MSASELPATWLSLSLGDVIDYGATTKAEPAEIAPDTWVLELEDVEKDTSKVTQRLTFAQRQSKSTKNRFEAGDVLYGKLRPYLNKVVFATTPGVCTTEIIPLKPNAAVNGRYLFHWVRHPEFLRYVTEVSHGVNMPRLGTEAGRQAPFVLAPMNEQRRIADKLDTVLARVDAVNERLARVAPLLKRLRQSVLAAATSGRLTEDWRGGAALDWKTLRADEACEKVQSGGTPKAGFSESGIPFLKVYNIVDQKIDFDYKPQYVTDDVNAGELRKSQVQPDDVLMNIVGPPLGKVAIVPDVHGAWNINQAITLFRPSGTVSSHWIYIVLCEGAPIRAVLSNTKGSVGQVNISLSQCRAFEFPVPTPEEQTEIVRRVELLFAYADRLEARLRAAQTATERLTPALLAKAFRGELVPQDPNDEPAAQLLQRLQASQATAAPQRRKARAAPAVQDGRSNRPPAQ